MHDSPNGARKRRIMSWAWGIVGIAVLAAIVVVLLGARTPQFTVERGGVRISNSLFGRTIPSADLDVGSARIIDFATSPDLAPKWRTFGIGLPGRQSGWYRLRNGSNALLFLTRSERILYLDTNRGYALLLTPDDADSLLKELKNSG